MCQIRIVDDPLDRVCSKRRVVETDWDSVEEFQFRIPWLQSSISWARRNAAVFRKSLWSSVREPRDFRRLSMRYACSSEADAMITELNSSSVIAITGTKIISLHWIHLLYSANHIHMYIFSLFLWNGNVSLMPISTNVD